MKNLILFSIMSLGLLWSFSAQSQATNNTSEPWTINYYGATTNVPGNSSNIPIAVGTDCKQGISVSSTATGNMCGTVVFTAPTTADVSGCATETDKVDFDATSDWTQGPCSPSASLLNPSFLFYTD